MNRDWVLRDAFGGTSPDLAADLTRAYSADFLAQWVQFMKGVTIVGPTDATDEMLKTTMKSDSPVLKLLRAVGDQSLLGADPEAGLGQVRADFALVHNFFAAAGGSTAGQMAAGLGKLLGQKSNLSDRNVPPSDLYLQVLQRAEKKYAEVAQPGTPPDQVKALLSGGDPASNPIKGAQAWVLALADQYGTAGATEASARILMLPLDRALGAVGQRVSTGLARKFEETVLAAFRPMSAKYPFNASGPDIAPYEFNEFFRATGTFWTFYNTELKDLVRPDGTPISADAASSVTPDMRGFVRMANDIREAFYASNPEAASLKVSVRTSALRIERPAGVNVRWVSFDLGGATATYNMGPPQWQDLVWPGPDASVGASLRVLLSSGTDAQSKNVPGPWGIFHMTDEAQVTQTAPNLVQALFKVPTSAGSVNVPYEIQTESGKSPFAPNFFRY
jgi:type VI protein secretion system component VasK